MKPGGDSFTTHGSKPGPRQERARQDRERRIARRRRRVRWLAVAGVVVVLAVVGAGAWLLTDGRLPWQPGEPDGVVRTDNGDDTAEAALETLPDQHRLLLVTAPDEGAGASSVTVIAGPAGDAPASMLFLPTGTLASVPGFGLERLGRSHQYGGAELLTATVENLLGVQLDTTAVATHDGFADFLDRTGGLTLDLDQRLVRREADGTGDVRFEQGEQQLDGERLVELWTFRSADDELVGARHRRLVLDALFAAADDEATLDRLVADGAPQLRSDADAEWLVDFFAQLSQEAARGAVRANLLPVESFGSADDDGSRAYRLQTDAAEELVGRFLGRADIDADGQVRVQVLNGVGVPGIGQLVDARLPGNARITLTGNASSFDFEETRILVYAEDADTLRVAERVQDALGVGTIQVSRQPQSVVDVTIVVGEDLVADAGGEIPAPDPDDPEQ